MKKNIIKSLLSLILSVSMLLTGLGLTVHADVGGDIGEEPGAGVSAGGVQDTVAKDLSDSTTGKGANMGIMGVNDPELTNKNVILTNGGSGTVITDNDIKVKVEFNVPVYGDFLNDDGSIMDGAAYFVKDDTVTLLLSEHFKFDPEPSASINLNYFDGTETITLGTVTLSNNESDQAQANIIFNGPEGIFSPEDTIIYSGVSAWFDASLKHNGNSMEGEDGNKTVAILDKTFQLKLPEDEKHYTVEKSVKDGAVDLVNGTIEWTVTITATQGVGGSNHIDLEGYVFEDDLQSVGGYVDNSFSLTGGTLEVPNVDSTLLRYTFPSGDKSPQTLTFKTYIPNDKYTNGGTVANTAGLRVDEDTPPIPSNEATANIPSLSVVKDAEIEDGFTVGNTTYNPTDRTITWSIKVNYDGRPLNGLKITDVLPGDLIFESAGWYKWDSNEVNWETTPTLQWAAQPDLGIYEIGDVDYIGKLVIVSKVPDELEEGSVNLKTYTNQASVSWKGKDDTGGAASSDEKGVNIGYDAIKKSASSTAEYKSNQEITWTINVDLKGQDVEGFVVYDLFVHDGATTDADLTNAVGWPSEYLTIEDTTNNIKGITRNNGQKFISSVPEANDTNTNSPQVDTVELYKGSDHIATLVKISNLSTTDMNTVVLKSQVIDPNIIAGNSPSQKVRNTASLYNGNIYRGKDYADINYNNKILDKEMLKRREVTNDHNLDTIDADNKTTNLTEGFNYNYKEVIFRLNINAAGIDFGSVQTNLNGGFGNVVVTDTLPQGWEFVNFSNNAKYLVYSANPLAFGNGVSLTTTGASVEGLTASFDNPENSPHTATFTFASPNLNKPYVILLKARPTDLTFEGYLLGDKNKIEETNLLNLKSANWEPGKDVKQKVEFDSKLIDKTLDKTKQSEGVLTWIVDYTPHGLKVGTEIEDKLPEGIDLRTDSHGQLIWEQDDGTRNINVYRLELKSDDSGYDYNVTSSQELGLDEIKNNISYDGDSRKLTFTFPKDEDAEEDEEAQAYRLIYVTDITNMPDTPETVNNTVKINGATGAGTGTNESFTLTDQGGAALMKRSGLLIVKKIAYNENNTLSGAVFTLYNTKEDGTRGSARGQRTTESDGLAKFYGLAPGNYILVETSSLSDYEEHLFEYAVTVADGTFETTVNGLQQIITNNSPFEVVNYLKNEQVGHLTISKTVIDNPDGGYDLDSFEFTILFEETGASGSSYTYIGHGGASGGTIKSGDTITLGPDQSITILGLPVGTRYTVTEKNYQPEGYTTTISGDIDQPIEPDEPISPDEAANIQATGTIIKKHKTYKVDFTNTQTIGELTIKKTVAGNAGDFEKKFKFYLALEDAADTEYPFTIYNRDAEKGDSGYIRSGGDFELAHGESITIKDLPAGASYTVTEEDYSADGYYTVKTGAVGVIEADQTKSAVFTNIRNVFYPGNLTITKTVTGPGADTEKAFDFVVTFNGATGSYNYTGVGVAAGTIKSGDTISLAHGQSITITGLPEGSTYQVKEVEASAEGYTVTAVGDEGTILPNAEAVAAFTNEHTISKIDVIGKKIWVGGPAEKPTIELQLYRDGVKFGAAVSLKNGSASYTWTGLDETDANGKAYKYTVDEVAVPENYKKSVSADGLTVTNTYVDPDSKEDTGSQIPTEPDDESKPDLPHTGEGRSTSALGLALILAGLALGLFAWLQQRPRKNTAGRNRGSSV